MCRFVAVVESALSAVAQTEVEPESDSEESDSEREYLRHVFGVGSGMQGFTKYEKRNIFVDRVSSTQISFSPDRPVAVLDGDVSPLYLRYGIYFNERHGLAVQAGILGEYATPGGEPTYGVNFFDVAYSFRTTGQRGRISGYSQAGLSVLSISESVYREVPGFEEVFEEVVERESPLAVYLAVGVYIPVEDSVATERGGEAGVALEWSLRIAPSDYMLHGINIIFTYGF